jgi:hypothetical protein
MKGKSLFVIIATIVFAWALWSGAMGACFEKMGSPNGPVILKIKKISEDTVTIRQSFHNTSVAFDKLFSAIFSDLGGPELVQRCEDQPVLFGALFIFVGVSICGIFFIVHMIRTDSRFS